MNLRPLGYEPNELPDCSTPRQEAQYPTRSKGLSNSGPPCASALSPQALSRGTATMIAADAKATALVADAIDSAPSACKGKRRFFDIDDSRKSRAASARLLLETNTIDARRIALRSGRMKDAGIGRSARTARMTESAILRAKEKALAQRALFFRFGGCEGRI